MLYPTELRQRGVEAATLIARCRANTTDAYIAWGECMDTDDSCVTVQTTGGYFSDRRFPDFYHRC